MLCVLLTFKEAELESVLMENVWNHQEGFGTPGRQSEKPEVNFNEKSKNSFLHLGIKVEFDP